MKKIILTLILLVSITVTSFAQIKKEVEVTRKKGIENITVNKVLWGTAKKRGDSMSYAQTMEIKDLKGKKIASAKFNVEAPTESEIPYLVITFTGSKRVVYKIRATDSPDFGYEIAKFLVDNDALTIEGLNKAGEDKMVALYGTRPSK